VLKEFLLFINSQFATDSQNVLHLNQCTHGHIWSWIVASFQRFGVVCEWLDMNKKMCWFVCFSWSWIHYGLSISVGTEYTTVCLFQLELNTLRFVYFSWSWIHYGLSISFGTEYTTVCLFQLELNTLRFSNVSIIKNLKDWGRKVVGLYFWNCSLTYIEINFFLAQVWETRSWSFAKNFRYIYVFCSISSHQTSTKPLKLSNNRCNTVLLT
jgi:hypothetical protein